MATAMQPLERTRQASSCCRLIVLRERGGDLHYDLPDAVPANYCSGGITFHALSSFRFRFAILGLCKPAISTRECWPAREIPLERGNVRAGHFRIRSSD